MKKIVLTGRWNEPVEFAWENSLEETLRKAEEKLSEEDNTGYFFETENSDKNWLEASGVPVFVNSQGVSMAPVGLSIVEDGKIIYHHD